MAGQFAEKEPGQVSLCVCATASEIGDPENISKSYVSRILRLALLTPDITEGSSGMPDQSLMLERLERPLTASWTEQRARFFESKASLAV